MEGDQDIKVEVSNLLLEIICTALDDVDISNADAKSETIIGNKDATNAEYKEETETDTAMSSRNELRPMELQHN